MRVLALLAVVTAALVATNACYDPSLKDCQFRCGSGGACPDGTSCMSGFCRTSTGQCMGGSGSGIDAPGGCPASPCGGTVKVIDNACWVECASQVQPTTAFQTCGSDTGASGTWFAAIIDTDTLRNDLKDPFKDGGAGWIGLVRSLSGDWHWMNPANEAQGSAQGTNGWAGGEPSGLTNSFATYDPNAGEYATGSAGDQSRFFCEARP